MKNLLSGALAASIIGPWLAPLSTKLLQENEVRHRGIVWTFFPQSARARQVASFLLLDHWIYLWHIGLHRVPLLWRYHAFHHCDEDLTLSTGVRFHAMELLLGVPLHLLVYRAIGSDERTFRIWQYFLFASVLFHHSNLRLPKRLERMASWILPTPRFHGIHHSSSPEERNCNWSSGLTFWDRIHGTLSPFLDRPQPRIGLSPVEKNS